MTELPEPPDEDVTLQLVTRAQAGDEGALEDLFERHHDHLLLAVRLRLGKRLRGVLESGDVLQSVALEVIRDLGDFTPMGPGSFRHFLHQVVHNKIRDRARYFDAAKRQGTVRASQTRLEQAPGRGSDTAYFDRTGRFERLEREIAQLPDEMRQVLVLRVVDGLPGPQVAELLGKTDVATRKTYSRAIARLAARLGEEEDA